jgi:hypothetical protein
MQKIPVRYIGHEVQLFKLGGLYFDGQGKPLEEYMLRHGDTLMMNAAEVLGQTFLTDPRNQSEPVWLGIGKVVLPEHQKLSNEDLIDIGYQFHGGRPDFEPIDVPSTEQAPEKADKKKKEAQ